MKKLFFTVAILLVTTTIALTQTYIKPKYEKRGNPRVELEKIQITKKFTIVYCTYTARSEGNACVDKGMYIKDLASKKTYPLIKTEGISICPRQKLFNKAGYTFHFKLYFPKIKHNVKYIHIIENIPNAFNFVKVHLVPAA